MSQRECASPVHPSQPVNPSQQSTASECSDDDAGEYRINVNTQAVVAWEGSHTKFNLHLQYDRAASTAFLKLRVNLVLKALSPAKTNLYLLIPPERIQTLELDDSPDPDATPPDLAELLGSGPTCLRVSLNAAIDLVGPKSVAHKPKTQADGRVLDELGALVRSAVFNIFMPHHVLTKPRLLSVCYGISDRLLRSDAGQLDLAPLYEGRGGVKIPVVESDKPVSPESGGLQQTSGDIPPPYTGAGPARPVATGRSEIPASKKRRLNSDASAELSSDLLAVMRKMVREEVRVQVSEEVQKLETRLNDRLYDLVNEQADIQSARWAEELEATSQEFDNKIEDDFYGVRIKMEDFIKEELAEAEDRIIDHLQSTASVHLEFGS